MSQVSSNFANPLDNRHIMTRNHATLIVFLIFFFGVISLILSLVSIQLSMLTFIDKPGRTFGLVVKLLMVFVGMIIMYVSKTGNEVD